MDENWSVIIKFHDCPNYFVENGYRYCAYEDGPKYCNKADCPIKEHCTNTESREVYMRLAKETCTLCSEETGRRIGSGIYEETMYPVLLSPVGLLKKGDVCGPVCEPCHVAMEQLRIIDNSV